MPAGASCSPSRAAAVYSDVVNEAVGPTHVVKKHLAGVKYEDISLAVGPETPAMLQWIKETLAQSYQRKDGSIIAADFDYKAKSEMEFFHALISEVQFPGRRRRGEREPCTSRRRSRRDDPPQARQRDVVHVLSPRASVAKGALGQPLPAALGLSGPRVARMTRVNQVVEAIVVKQKVVQDSIGEVRDYQREPQSLEVGNVTFTVPEVDAEPFYAWLQTFVVQGQNDDGQEKDGTLEYLAADLKTVLYTVTLKSCGVFKMSPDKVEAGSENIRRVKVEMYCEDIAFDYQADKAL
jgi:hypothetical protein